jgi:hypothetical protein
MVVADGSVVAGCVDLLSGRDVDGARIVRHKLDLRRHVAVFGMD